MKVGIVKYINALPFHSSALHQHEVTFDHPVELNKKLQAGQLDCALTSSIEYLRGDYERLPFGIVASGPVLSVNLYHSKKIPLSQAKLALSKASATSNCLLKVLCHHFWKIKPTFVSPDEPHDGYLLIGDVALGHRQDDFEEIDLAKSWFEATGLPFVFAVFTLRKNLFQSQVDELKEVLNGSLNLFEKNPSEVLKNACTLSHHSKALLEDYYRKLYYRLGQREIEGLELFGKLAKYVQ